MLGNISIQERHAELKDTRKQCWVIEYFSVYPGLTCPTPPPPGSFFSLTCVMGKLKPQPISPKQEFFTSLLYNPVTPAAFKSQCARARACGRAKPSPNSKSVPPAARFRHTKKSRQPSNRRGAEQWLDMMLCDLTGDSRRDFYLAGGRREMLMQGKQGADAVFNSETLTSSVIHWTPSMLTKWERLYKPLLKMSRFSLA